MARIRTIKPEFPEDEKLGACTRDARLLFVLIWTLCDDHGRFRAAPVFLRTHLFPYDLDITPQDIAGWLQELDAKRRVSLYESEGESYGEVVNWSKHQRIDNAGKPLYPDPPRLAANLGESQRNAAGPPTTDQDHDPDHPHAESQRTAGSFDLGEVWKIMADDAVKNARSVSNPTAFRRKCAENAAKDHAERAAELMSQYPGLTAPQLADCLLGRTNILRSLRRVS